MDIEENNLPLSTDIREVRVPKLKYRAKSYHTMIYWNCELKTELPYIAMMTEDQLTHILSDP